VPLIVTVSRSPAFNFQQLHASRALELDVLFRFAKAAIQEAVRC